jgi:hypothetical protein
MVRVSVSMSIHNGSSSLGIEMLHQSMPLMTKSRLVSHWSTCLFQFPLERILAWNPWDTAEPSLVTTKSNTPSQWHTYWFQYLSPIVWPYQHLGYSTHLNHSRPGPQQSLNGNHRHFATIADGISMPYDRRVNVFLGDSQWQALYCWYHRC